MLTTIILPDLLAIATIKAEAGNQLLHGMQAVGEVIRNRTKRKYNSDGSIIGTVLRPFQFSCWNHDATNRSLMIRSLTAITLSNTIPQVSVSDAIVAWKYSESSSLVLGAVLYHTQWIAPKWIYHPNVKKIVQIGDHIFYDEVI